MKLLGDPLQLSHCKDRVVVAIYTIALCSDFWVWYYQYLISARVVFAIFVRCGRVVVYWIDCQGDYSVDKFFEISSIIIV